MIWGNSTKMCLFHFKCIFHHNIFVLLCVWKLFVATSCMLFCKYLVCFHIINGTKLYLQTWLYCGFFFKFFFLSSLSLLKFLQCYFKFYSYSLPLVAYHLFSAFHTIISDVSSICYAHKK